MNTKNRPPFRISRLTLLVCLNSVGVGAVFPSSAPARQVPTAATDNLRSQPFHAYLQRLSKAKGTAVVLENWHSFPPKDDPLIQESDYSSGKLGEIADRYDYSLEVFDTVIVLKRLYSTPNDLPSLTLEEGAESLQDIVRLLSKFSSGMDTSPVGHPTTMRFIRSLTSEQVAYLSGKEGLPLRSLNTAQRSQVRQMSYYFYLGNTEESAKVIAQHFQCAALNRMTLGWHTDSNATQFGYYAEEISTGKVSFRPLRTVDGRPVAWNGRIDFRGTRYGVDTSISTAIPSDKNAPSLEIPRLSTEMDQLNRSETGQRKYEVDAALAEKNVVVIGGDQTTPLRLQRAVAYAYRLRVKSEPGRSTYTISRPVVGMATVAAELRGKVLDALPEPIVRAVTNGSLRPPAPSENSRRQTSTAGIRNPENVKIIEEMRKKQLQGGQRQRHLYVLRNLALDRLQRVARDPTMKRKVPLDRLSRETKSALAFILLTDLFGEASQLTRETPAYVTQFEDVVLKGGPTRMEDGSKFFKLEFAHKRTDGQVINDVAGFITRLPDENQP